MYVITIYALTLAHVTFVSKASKPSQAFIQLMGSFAFVLGRVVSSEFCKQNS